MNEVYRTCGGDYTLIAVTFIIIIALAVLFAYIQCASDGEFSKWIGGWFRYWIDKLPKPKNDD